ncbi:MAG: glutamine--tRNA ligase/YqeY domain fusion protein [Clostridia bacterium]|nr:glutamine--tRNA ligase/YqeY domain fusion protein [Clostridia bacterium]
MEKDFSKPMNFIDEIVAEEIASGKYRPEEIQTRYPPEPNGYMHIGHAKAIYINFSISGKYGGKCNLRFDDTNPAKEEEEFVDGIIHDINWLGYKQDAVFFGSDYFDKTYELAIKLIKKGAAYVDDLDKDQMREYRGTLTTPGKNSPYRDRSVEENLDLFERMKNGEFPNGAKTLRAKIDMASPNLNMRDPAIYRILHMRHHHQGDKWCIYPMYDFAHPIQDALEGVTHSLCSKEYEAHRPLYDWVVEQCEFEHKPRQIEFARLNITNTVMSKRYLRALVEGGLVSGWDDPRMPTLAGLRRRGYTPSSIQDFLKRTGVAKADSVADAQLLEHCIREELNEDAMRAIAVTEPVKVVVTNWEDGKVEDVEMENHPAKPELGTRTLHFGKELYIEKADFMMDPPKKFFRMFPGGEVRLKGAYIVKCQGADVDENGNVTCIYVTYDPTSKSGMEGANRKVKGTLHWLSKEDAKQAKIRLYDYMLKDEEEVEEESEDEEYVSDHTAAAKAYTDRFNKDSLIEINDALVEPFLAECEVGERFQFMRTGYFIKDSDSTEELPVFNRIVGLKDSYKPKA